MKTIKLIFLIILFLTFSYNNLFSQGTAKFVLPKVSLVSHYEHILDTAETFHICFNFPEVIISTPPTKPSKNLEYKLSLSVIVRDKGNISSMPLIVSVISPFSISHSQMLERDISKMDINKIYVYNFQVNTNGSGWFLVELLSNIKNSDVEIIFDKYKVYFGN